MGIFDVPVLGPVLALLVVLVLLMGWPFMSTDGDSSRSERQAAEEARCAAVQREYAARRAAGIPATPPSC